MNLDNHGLACDTHWCGQSNWKLVPQTRTKYDDSYLDEVCLE